MIVQEVNIAKYHIKTGSVIEPLTTAKIIQTINNYYGLDCRKKTRKSGYVLARHIAIYFARKYTADTLFILRDIFNKKNHTTISLSAKKVKDMYEHDKIIKEAVNYFDKIFVECLD